MIQVLHTLRYHLSHNSRSPSFILSIVMILFDRIVPNVAELDLASSNLSPNELSTLGRRCPHLVKLRLPIFMQPYDSRLVADLISVCNIFELHSLSLNPFPLLTVGINGFLNSRNCMNWKSWVYPLMCLRRFENNRRWRIGSEENCTCLVCGVRIPRTSLAYARTATSSTRPRTTATWMFGNSLIM